MSTEHENGGGMPILAHRKARPSRPRPWRPVVTIALIALNAAVYLLQLVWSSVQGALVFGPVIGAAEPWRFITSAFLHAGFWHILLNMYALWLVGVSLERAIGRWRFASIYMLSAVGGNVFVLLTSSPQSDSWVTGTVGASGAVFGLFGALAVLMRRLGGNYTQLLIVIALNLILGFAPGANISWQSHVGGLLIGAAAMAITISHDRRSRSRGILFDTMTYVAILAVLALAAVWKYYTVGWLGVA